MDGGRYKAHRVYYEAQGTSYCFLSSSHFSTTPTLIFSSACGALILLDGASDEPVVYPQGSAYRTLIPA